MLIRIDEFAGAAQSSRDATHQPDPAGAEAALKSAKTGGFAFHTSNHDKAPWWQAELAEPAHVGALVIFNRDRYQERTNSLTAYVSIDGQDWQEVFANGALPAYDQRIGSAQTAPRVIWLDQPNVRFVRLALGEQAVFHLDGVDIYRVAEDAASPQACLDIISGQLADGSGAIVARNLTDCKIAPADIATLVAKAAPTDALYVAAEAMAILGIDAETQPLVAEKAAIPDIRLLAALTRGYLKSSAELAKKYYDKLALSEPDYAEIRAFHEGLLAVSRRQSEQVVKLIVWDLDDTLWEGTLAEGDDVKPYEARVALVKQAVDHGIINSIVSKNDRQTTIDRLKQEGLLDYFVRPAIAFQPKGEMTKKLISDLQLREQNVVFVDDNRLNLQEVGFYCPRVQTLDATDPKTDEIIAGILAKSPRDGGKRHRDYDVLARKLDEEDTFSGDNEDFLRSSQIRIALIKGSSNFKFAARIQDLVNRSNQMNFLKTRIPDGTATHIVGDNQFIPYTVFVRDKFGSYGMVGFACVQRKTSKLIHFAFSCRAMNMKVEQIALSYIEEEFGPQDVPITAERPDYIEVVTKPTFDFEVDMEAVAKSSKRDIRVMANCQGGIIAHYLGLPDRADAEEAPDIFTLSRAAELAPAYAKKYKYLIYGIFVDYLPAYWNDYSPALFRARLTEALTTWTDQGVTVILLVPPKRPTVILDRAGEPVCTYADISDVIEDVSASFDKVKLVEIDDFIEDPEDVSADLRHFSRTLLKRVGEHVRTLIPTEAAASAQSERVEALAQ